MSFFVDTEIVVWCEEYRRSRAVNARMYDRQRGQFYSGSGATAFEAIAWCLDDYVRRGVLGYGPTPAMRSDAQPGENLIAPAPTRARRITPNVITANNAVVLDGGGCIESQVPISPAPRLFGDAPSTPVTKRKARR